MLADEQFDLLSISQTCSHGEAAET